MNDLIKEIASHANSLYVAMPYAALVTVFVVVFFSKSFQNKFERLFLVLNDDRVSRKTEEEIILLKKMISKLQDDKSLAVSDEMLENLKRTLNTKAAHEIQEIVDKHLKTLSTNEDPIVRHFENEVRESVSEIIQKVPLHEQVLESIKLTEAKQRQKGSLQFDQLIYEQLSTANKTRGAMMNLFVVINLSLLTVFALFPERFTDRSSLSILGMYISLSIFIIYIYRASNARSASLLAIKEDDKKLSNLFEFLTVFKKSTTFSSNDVEIIRTLLINRIEREKGADHPYEVVLKGVTNSNVLVRGGKVLPTNSK